MSADSNPLFSTKDIAEQLLEQGNKTSDFNAALILYQQALDIYEKAQDQAGIASAYNNLGITYTRLNKKELALDFLHKALNLWKEICDRVNEAIAQLNIGWVYENFDEIIKALGAYHKALTIQEEIGKQKDIADTLQIIGAVYERQAIKLYRQAIATYKEIGDKKAIRYLIKNTKIRDLIAPTDSDLSDVTEGTDPGEPPKIYPPVTK